MPSPWSRLPSWSNERWLVAWRDKIDTHEEQTNAAPINGAAFVSLRVYVTENELPSPPATIRLSLQ